MTVAAPHTRIDCRLKQANTTLEGVHEHGVHLKVARAAALELIIAQLQRGDAIDAQTGGGARACSNHAAGNIPFQAVKPIYPLFQEDMRAHTVTRHSR